MNQKLLREVNTDALREAANELAPQTNETLLVLLAEHADIKIHAVQEVLRETGHSFFGGLFPGLIYGEEKLDKALVLLKLPAQQPPFVIESLDWSPETLVPVAEAPHRFGMVILVDGLMGMINDYLQMINNALGDRFSFIGGGAGSLTLVQQDCLMTNEGVFQNAVVGCLLEQRVRLGIRHGWQRLAGPFMVTEADGNTLQKLNWRPAMDVYREVVEPDTGAKLDPENFFSYAKGYPFGIIREQEEDIVRDPIAVNEDGSLLCVGELPLNAAIYILKGERDELVGAARKAFQDCQTATPPRKGESLLVVDCISRTLFLEDDFKLELSELFQEGQTPLGILSLGEIASFGAGALEFFNKTIVLGQLQD